MLLFVGLCIGAIVGIASSYEPLLSSVSLLISILFPTSVGLGFIIAFIAVNSVTKYISSILTPDADLEANSTANKINAKKTISLAKMGMTAHYTAMNLCLVAATLALPLLGKLSGLLVGSYILPLSVFILGVLWAMYIFKGNVAHKLFIVVALAALSFFAITTQNSKGTIILFSSLFSLNAAVAGLGKVGKKIVVEGQKEIGAVKGLPVVEAALAGILSSIMIGFPGAAADKVIGAGRVRQAANGKLKTNKNEVHETLISAISNGIQSGLGVVLFLLGGVTRDSASTILGSLFTGITLLPVQIAVIIVLFIVLTTIAKFFFNSFVTSFINYHNWKLDNKLDSIARFISLAVIILFIILASPSNIIILGLIVAGCFGVNTYIKHFKLDRELIGVVTVLMPGMALAGIL